MLRISPKDGEPGEVTVRYKMLVRAAADTDGTIQALQQAGAKLTFDANGRPAEIYFGSKATDEHLPLLKGLTHLKRLNLETAKITDAALENLAGLTELESLSLYQTGVTDAGLAHLKGWFVCGNSNWQGTRSPMPGWSTSRPCRISRN